MNYKLITIIFITSFFSVDVNRQSLFLNILEYNKTKSLPENISKITEIEYSVLEKSQIEDGVTIDTTFVIDGTKYPLAIIKNTIYQYNKPYQEIEIGIADTITRNYNAKGLLEQKIIKNQNTYTTSYSYDDNYRFIKLTGTSTNEKFDTNEELTCKYYNNSQFEISEINSRSQFITTITSDKKNKLIEYKEESSLVEETGKELSGSKTNFPFPKKRTTLEITEANSYIYDSYRDSNNTFPNSFHTKHEYDEFGNLILEMKWVNTELREHTKYQYLDKYLLHKEINVLSDGFTEYFYDKSGKILREVNRSSVKEYQYDTQGNLTAILSKIDDTLIRITLRDIGYIP